MSSVINSINDTNKKKKNKTNTILIKISTEWFAKIIVLFIQAQNAQTLTYAHNMPQSHRINQYCNAYLPHLQFVKYSLVWELNSAGYCLSWTLHFCYRAAYRLVFFIHSHSFFLFSSYFLYITLMFIIFVGFFLSYRIHNL